MSDKYFIESIYLPNRTNSAITYAQIDLMAKYQVALLNLTFDMCLKTPAPSIGRAQMKCATSTLMAYNQAKKIVAEVLFNDGSDD